MALTISGFTMNAILSDPDWKNLLKKYREQSITNDMAKRMRDVANGAHAKHLPPGAAPTLSLGRMKRLWKDEKKHIDRFLYHLAAARPEDGPKKVLSVLETFRLNWAISRGKLDTAVPVIVAITDALKEVVSLPEIAVQLQEYRSIFKNSDWKESKENTIREREVQDQIMRKVRAKVTSNLSLNQDIVGRALGFLEVSWG